MNSYLAIYENGNGYSCDCCRRTTFSTDVLEFENDEVAKTHAENYNKNNNKYLDSTITSIYALSSSIPIY